MIPKVAYFFWGNSKLSFLRHWSVKSFKLHHPDWQVVVYVNVNRNEERRWTTCEQSDATYYSGWDWLDTLSRFADIREPPKEATRKIYNIDKHMAAVHFKDLLGWWILADCGGLICDMDVLWLSPFLDTEQSKADAVISLLKYPELEPYCPITILAGQPCDAWKNMLASAMKRYDAFKYESCGSDHLKAEVARGIERAEFMDASRYCPFVVKHGFYPGLDMIHKSDCYEDLPLDTFAIHWYAGTPLSAVSNLEITQKTYRTHNSTLARAIREMEKHA